MIAVAAAGLFLGTRSSPIAVSGTRIVTANPDSVTVTVIDDRDTAGEMLVGGSPQSVAVAPDGLRAYVASRDGMLSVVGLARRAVVASFRVDRDGFGVVADGNRLCFSAPGSSGVHVLDASTLARIGAVTTEEYLLHIFRSGSTHKNRPRHARGDERRFHRL